MLTIWLRASDGARAQPDFLHPPPEGPSTDLERELARMVATPPEHVRREVSGCYAKTGVPEVLRGFLQAPKAAIADLADLLRAYWERVLAPDWERIRAALEGDVLGRAQQAASKGIRALLGEIDQSVRYETSRLIIEDPWSGSVDLDGRGLLLVPSVFAGPSGLSVSRPSRRAPLSGRPDGPGFRDY